MTHPVPGLKDLATNVVLLSKLKGALAISIPNSADIQLEHNVRAILGDDAEKPDWTGPYAQFARWNEESGEVERAQDFSTDVSKDELGKWVNKFVQLRYQSCNESGDVTSSYPLELRIEP